MDSAPLNWEALDALIIDFARSENLIEDSFSSSPPSSPSPSPSSLSSSSYHSRLIIRHIRRSLEAGHIDSAIHLLRLHAPFILDDHRLLFRLHKQKFIELLRKGTAEDRDLAIQCLRTALAPCALDAYPEAYEEFKHVLLAFIYDKDNQTSPVTYEWSERRRFDIAGLMSSVLRAHMQAYDPVFSMTLRYLISIHKGFCFREGVSSPISDLTERLLLDERDPPATPKESLYEAPPFDEVDIQALAHAVELTRQGAIDSLRFTKGDLFHAFQNELCRMKLDLSVLDELVREYCIYRGIVDSGRGPLPGMQNLSSSSKINQSELEYCSSRNCSFEVDHATSKLSDGEISVGNSRVDSSPENIADVTSSQERSKRKRWRGRHDDRGLHDVSYSGCSKQELSTATVASITISKDQQNLEKQLPLESTCKEDKYEIVLGIREMASKRLAAEVVEEINALDPNFFMQNPILLFQLKQVEFFKLVSTGDYSSGLRVACTHLGPLAANDPSLLKQLKETLLALLLPNEDLLGKGFPINALANSLQVAFGRRLGIEEPQLMKLMRATLHSHSEWFKLQMCKDRFESLLKIDSLKEVNPPLLSTSSGLLKSNSDSCTLGSSQVTKSSGARTSEDGSSPIQASSRDACDENAILKVMEFLALPRADAIHLLAQYNGNAEMVIQQIFA
ncbi:uncharacterized protein LOC111005585 isoform X2 [Momordica charantia]|uniref:Uncharacterized protein LOC111005585 isoform X2 n=1 Tax=Momordica charantia TaxID=3673 RepID=A0A6J1BU78_MOMCH|nr:uncharacterized protein LOC111005585 isoform X2 [Momordica charantia]